jgi:hypothetical protein
MTTAAMATTRLTGRARLDGPREDDSAFVQGEEEMALELGIRISEGRASTAQAPDQQRDDGEWHQPVRQWIKGRACASCIE